MQNVQPSLFSRDDTFFGVCQGLGEDLGFNPHILRVALPILLFFQPVAALGFYAAAGVVVFGSRMLVREPKRVIVEDEAVVVEAEEMELPLAA